MELFLTAQPWLSLQTEPECFNAWKHTHTHAHTHLDRSSVLYNKINLLFKRSHLRHGEYEVFDRTVSERERGEENGKLERDACCVLTYTKSIQAFSTQSSG